MENPVTFVVKLSHESHPSHTAQVHVHAASLQERIFRRMLDFLMKTHLLKPIKEVFFYKGKNFLSPYFFSPGYPVNVKNMNPLHRKVSFHIMPTVDTSHTSGIKIHGKNFCLSEFI